MKFKFWIWFRAVKAAFFLFLMTATSGMATVYTYSARQCADSAHSGLWDSYRDAFDNLHPFVVQFSDGQFSSQSPSGTGTSGLICDYLPSSRLGSTATGTTLTSYTPQPGAYADGFPTPADTGTANGITNAIGWYSPLENGSFFSGLYLVTQVERALRSGSYAQINPTPAAIAQAQLDAAQAQTLANGLIKSATCTIATSGSITGFIGRGFGTDGICHYPGSSDDQQAPWFLGLYAYWSSSIPTQAEKDAIANVVLQVATALNTQPSSTSCKPWAQPYDGAMTGQYRVRLVTDQGFRNSARYLLMLRAVSEMAQKTSGVAPSVAASWQQQFLTSCTTTVFATNTGTNRLQYIAGGMGPEMMQSYNSQYQTSTQSIAYVYVGSVLSLNFLIKLDPTNASYYQAGLDNTLSYITYPNHKNWQPNFNSPVSFAGANSWINYIQAAGVDRGGNWRSLIWGPDFKAWVQLNQTTTTGTAYAMQNPPSWQAAIMGGATTINPTGAQETDGDAGNLATFESSTFPQPVLAGGRDEGGKLRYPATCAIIAAAAGAGNDPNNRQLVVQYLQKYGVVDSTKTVTVSGSSVNYTPDYKNTYGSAIFYCEMAYYAMPSSIEFYSGPADVTGTAIYFNATSSGGALVSYTSTPAITGSDLDYGGVVTVVNGGTANLSVGSTYYPITGTSTTGVSGTAPIVLVVTDLASINTPSNISATATGTSGAFVSIPSPVTANLTYGGQIINAANTLTSGTFKVGTTTGTCTATSPNNSAVQISSTYTVTVTDLGTIHTPNLAPVAATGTGGAIVTWPTVMADLTYGGSVSATTSKASGTTFVIGSTIVTCTATSSNNSAVKETGTFTVMVTDLGTMNMPGLATIPATGTGGAIVTWPAVTTNLTYGGTVSATTSKASGANFTIGTTTVTCTSTSPVNSAVKETGTFTITVTDLAGINTPLPAAVYATGSGGAAVSWPAVTGSLTYGGTVAATTSKASGSIFPIGTTPVTCIATSPVNPSITATTTFNVTVLPSYKSWQGNLFSTAQLSIPAICGDTATPAGDGISNLMKYALNLNPFSNGVGGLPICAISGSGNNNYLTLKYNQVIQAGDISYIPEVSGDLRTWSSGTVNILQLSATNNPDGLTQTIVTQDLVPVTGTNKRFMRLKVTRP